MLTAILIASLIVVYFWAGFCMALKEREEGGSMNAGEVLFILAIWWLYPVLYVMNE